VKAKNYTEALTCHLQWQVQFKKFLDGEGDFDIAKLSLENCKLGKWLHSNGICKYAPINELRQIEQVHAKFHECAERVYGLKMRGGDFETRQELKRMEEVSMMLASFLTTLKAVNGSNFISIR